MQAAFVFAGEAGAYLQGVGSVVGDFEQHLTTAAIRRVGSSTRSPFKMYSCAPSFFARS
jgi:hypothetical protein